MARRTGKAASRRSTRRNRSAPRRPSIPTPPPSSPSPSAATSAAGDEPAATAEPPRSTATEAPVVRGPAYASTGTALGERARLEYHYVGRDLRNIAVLTAIMAALLLVAYLVLPATGLVSR